MDYYKLKLGRITRSLPVVTLGPKIKIASINLLGDVELVDYLAKKMARKIGNLEFDYLVGPEVKVVPLLHEISKILGKERYFVCRKQIHGYMVSPISSFFKPGLVIDGSDAKILKGKKVVVVDDVVSSGNTMKVMDDLMRKIEVKIVLHMAVFRQGKKDDKELAALSFLEKLPVFTS